MLQNDVSAPGAAPLQLDEIVPTEPYAVNAGQQPTDATPSLRGETCVVAPGSRRRIMTYNPPQDFAGTNYCTYISEDFKGGRRQGLVTIYVEVEGSKDDSLGEEERGELEASNVEGELEASNCSIYGKPCLTGGNCCSGYYCNLWFGTCQPDPDSNHCTPG